MVAHDLGIPEADYIVHAANAYPKFVEMLKTISTGNGRLSVAKDLEAVLRKIEYWHQEEKTRNGILSTLSVNPPRKQRMSFRATIGHLR